MRKQIQSAVLSGAALGVATALMRATGDSNPTTIALGYLLVVLFIAYGADLWLAASASVMAAFCFNFFFLPPVWTLQVTDPNNWIELAVFMVVSITASQLSAKARSRAQEALERRLELNRLFDLTRDVLLTTEREGAFAAIARHVARRFELQIVAICLPSAVRGWDVHHGGDAAPLIADAVLDRAVAGTADPIELDARDSSHGGHRGITVRLKPDATEIPVRLKPDATVIPDTTGIVTLTPIRHGTRAIGLLVCGGRPLEPGTRDAVAGVVAIAVERSHLLDQRRAAEFSAQRAELSSALLASLSHDLRTPLTSIRAAISNIATAGFPERQRLEQAAVAEEQAARLTHLFDEILDMARIDAGVITPRPEWTTPAEVVDAALAHAAGLLAQRTTSVDAADVMVHVDPRLSASAFAHLVENAARYSPPGSTIGIRGWTDQSGLRLEVRDDGPGLDPADIEHLFEPLYRGRSTCTGIAGTGMGLAIARGLLAAQGGRVWAENVIPHGALFSIAVPGSLRPAPEAD